MGNSKKKLETILCLIAGVGLFLPLLKISAYGESASVSFMTMFDLPGITESGVFNSKIVLGVIIVAFLLLIVRTLNKDSFAMKLVSFMLIIASAVLFYINVDKISAAKGIMPSAIKYGIGYYATLISLIVAFILGLLDLFSNNSSNRDIEDIERIINNYHTNRQQINPTGYPNNSVNNQSTSPNNTVTNTQMQNPIPNNNVKLSDLVNNNAQGNVNTPNNNDVNEIKNNDNNAL